MKRIAVIGGSGHIGSYLTPRLVEAGFDTVCVSRGNRSPYFPNSAWSQVTHVLLDREDETSPAGLPISMPKPLST